MSSDVVTGFGLQFTNDNKFCYAYSGARSTSSSNTTFIDFTTNSEYIVARIQPVYFSQGTNNIAYQVDFNGSAVQYAEVTSSRDYTPFQDIHLIIPPFTRVEIKLDNLSGGSEVAGVALTGKVGMPQRVGNLDD